MGKIKIKIVIGDFLIFGLIILSSNKNEVPTDVSNSLPSNTPINTATPTVTELPSLGNAVDFPNLTWITGGVSNWYYIKSNSAKCDGDAARTGTIMDNQTTYLQTTVTGECKIDFYWKVSSEQNDFLVFYIDGYQMNQISGDIDWTHMTYILPAGTHTLMWMYIKDISNTAGEDAGWIDCFNIENITATHTATQQVINTSTATNTETQIMTNTATSTATNTETFTIIYTPTVTNTNTVTTTYTMTQTFTKTETPSLTSTSTPTPTPTITPTATLHWVIVGNPGFSSGLAKYISLCIDNGTPYVAYQDGGNLNKATVRKYNGSNWEGVGQPGFTTSSAHYLSLYIESDIPYVAYRGESNKATVMKYNGSNWETVGQAGFSAFTANYTSLYINNGTPYVAYQDQGNSNKATVMRYNGSYWESVGSAGFTPSLASYTSLYIYNGTPYVAFQDGANSFRITVMRSE